MDIVEWFDPHNIEHVKAYDHLNKKGMWPPGFIPLNVTLNPVWNTGVAFKIADAYLNEKLHQETISVPRHMLDTKTGNYELTEGIGWLNVPLDAVGELVQKITGAVSRLLAKSVVLKLVAADYPRNYNHWNIKIESVVAGNPEDFDTDIFPYWPCCSCDKTLGEKEHGYIMMLDKLAKWEFPVWGNVLEGSGGRAVAVCCRACFKAGRKPLYAIKKDGKNFVRISVTELEDL